MWVVSRNMKTVENVEEARLSRVTYLGIQRGPHSPSSVYAIFVNEYK